jgi:hypothetical protein
MKRKSNALYAIVVVAGLSAMLVVAGSPSASAAQ